MSSTKILAQGRTKLNGIISPILRGGKNFSENNSIVLNAKMLTDEYLCDEVLQSWRVLHIEDHGY